MFFTLPFVLLQKLERTTLRAESAEKEVELLKEQLIGLEEQLDEVYLLFL